MDIDGLTLWSADRDNPGVAMLAFGDGSQPEWRR
jgi:hypothetical protein